jgi:hypothetical protein
MTMTMENSPRATSVPPARQRPRGETPARRAGLTAQKFWDGRARQGTAACGCGYLFCAR